LRVSLQSRISYALLPASLRKFFPGMQAPLKERTVSGGGQVEGVAGSGRTRGDRQRRFCLPGCSAPAPNQPAWEGSRLASHQPAREGGRSSRLARKVRCRPDPKRRAWRICSPRRPRSDCLWLARAWRRWLRLARPQEDLAPSLVFGVQGLGFRIWDLGNAQKSRVKAARRY